MLTIPTLCASVLLYCFLEKANNIVKQIKTIISITTIISFIAQSAFAFTGVIQPNFITSYQNGVTTTYSYDALFRLTEISYGTGMPVPTATIRIAI